MKEKAKRNEAWIFTKLDFLRASISKNNSYNL